MAASSCVPHGWASTSRTVTIPSFGNANQWNGWQPTASSVSTFTTASGSQWIQYGTVVISRIFGHLETRPGKYGVR